ncbi:hypothetical protein ACOZ4N_11700 [Halorientalis pallida]|uniref:hypothetical protein n=1 Tax=Halorientalis pallida TaxID=2479928 RepID=UPI003C6F4CD5
MDGQQFLDRVRENERTALERLGSDKALLAATGADLDTDTVLGVLAATELFHADAFRRWSEETDDERVAEAFATAAETAGDHADRLDADLDAVPDESGVETGVGGQDGDGERAAAGLVGASLVLDRILLQAVNFFVNEADERRADLIRAVRSEADDRRDAGLALLADLCESDDEWERAATAAEAAVAAAYDDYVATLDDMGIDPKPVC